MRPHGHALTRDQQALCSAVAVGTSIARNILTPPPPLPVHRQALSSTSTATMTAGEPLFVSIYSGASSNSAPSSPSHARARSTARGTRMAGGLHESRCEPVHWLPASNAGPGLPELLPLRTPGTGTAYTLDSSMRRASTPINCADFLSRSRDLSPSRMHAPEVMNGSLSLHRTAKATGHLSPMRHRVLTHNDLAVHKFDTQSLQRGGISHWG